MLTRVLVLGLLLGMVRAAAAEQPPKKLPVTITADKLDYDRAADTYVAEGHVKIEEKNIILQADTVTMNNRTGEAEAEGNVYLQDPSDVIHATTLKVNMNSGSGVIRQGDIFLKKENLHLKGDVIERRTRATYRIEHGMFTTCDEYDWFIKADELNIDMNRYATGNHVTLNLAGVPVLYTPYLLFPVRRQSGLLIPDFGYSSKDGFFMNNALFWAISDSRDMTFYSDYRAQTGHGAAVEYRYNNSQESLGQAYVKAWDLYRSHVWRWDLRFQHQEEFTEELSAKIDINLVSDEKYYYDLEKKIEMRSQPSVDSNAFYIERWSTSSLLLLGQYTTDLTRPNNLTIQKLPELRYTIFEEALAGPLHLNFDGSATNFYVQAADGVRRAHFNPELAATFGDAGLSMTPRAGVRATFYDRSGIDAGNPEPTERKYTYATLDINARLSRVYGEDRETGIGRMRHSIEPALSYTYIPHVDQGSIPQFDFVDKVDPQNKTTFTVINRLTAHYKESRESTHYTTFDLAVFRLSQSYGPGATADSSTRTRSSILGELFVKTPKTFTAAGNATYDTYTKLISSRALGATYDLGFMSVNLSEQYIHDPATHYVIGGGHYKIGKWDLGGQWWRDIVNKKTTQEEYRVQYRAQCWGVDLSYTVKPGEYQYAVLLNLEGIGGNKMIH